MPNYLDYGKMHEMDPWANMQANSQLELAKLFHAQKLQQEQATTEKLGLDNQYTSRTLDERVRRPGLENIGLEQDNRSKKIKADMEEATYPEALRAKMAEYAKTKSDADFTIAENKIKRGLQSEDPNIRAQAERAWRMSVEMRKMKQQHEDAISLQEMQGRQRLREIGAQTAGQKEVANLKEQARLKAKEGSGNKIKSLMDALKTGKVSPQNALAAARMEYIQSADDPQTQAMWQSFSQELQTILNNLPGAAAAGKPDLAGAGVPVRPAPNPYGGGPKPGTAENPIKLD